MKDDSTGVFIVLTDDGCRAIYIHNYYNMNKQDKLTELSHRLNTMTKYDIIQVIEIK